MGARVIFDPVTMRTRSDIVRDDHESAGDPLSKNPFNLLGHVAACFPCADDEDAPLFQRKVEVVYTECVLVEFHVSAYDAGGICGLESFVHCSKNVMMEFVEASGRRQPGVNLDHRWSRMAEPDMLPATRT